MNEITHDPSRPAVYPHRILLAVTGLSPQVVTETLYALAVEREPAFIPTEIHVISTAEGAERIRLELLHRSTGHFQRLCTEYRLGKIHFNEDCIHTVDSSTGIPLNDIQTDDDNTRAADAIIELVRKFTEDADSALHVSIAGGRKTMGFYLGYALSLYGRAQDRLSHVLVSEPFESHHEFFFPPKNSDVLYTKDNKPIHTSDAHIMLAEIPFVRMRHGLPEDLLEGRASFSEVVASAQATLGPEEVLIDMKNAVLSCGEKVVRLPPILFAWYAWMARRRCAGGGHQGRIRWNEVDHLEFLDVYRRIVGEMSGDYERAVQALKNGFVDKESFLEKNSRINKALVKMLGKRGAEPYRIVGMGVRPETRYGLMLEPSQIRFGEVDNQTLLTKL